MNRSRLFINYATSLALVATGFVANTDLAIAQQASDDQAGKAIEEVVKIEAQIEHRLVGRPSALGSRTEIFEIKRQVSFADLDMRKVADVTELTRRIENAAKEACEQLAEMHPIPVSSKADIRRCIKEAIESADDGVETAILIAAAE